MFPCLMQLVLYTNFLTDHVMTHDTAVLADSTFDLSETSSVIPLYTQTTTPRLFLISSTRASVVFNLIAVCVHLPPEGGSVDMSDSQVRLSIRQVPSHQTFVTFATKLKGLNMFPQNKISVLVFWWVVYMLVVKTYFQHRWWRVI